MNPRLPHLNNLVTAEKSKTPGEEGKDTKRAERKEGRKQIKRVREGVGEYKNSLAHSEAITKSCKREMKNTVLIKPHVLLLAQGQAGLWLCWGGCTSWSQPCWASPGAQSALLQPQHRDMEGWQQDSSAQPSWPSWGCPGCEPQPWDTDAVEEQSWLRVNFQLPSRAISSFSLPPSLPMIDCLS